ncbi:MAG TPA: hypothetical protein PKW80_09005 [Bacteroidales bacterium]|nr:hypothetical protein [Bacteroidales bacterium]
MEILLTLLYACFFIILILRIKFFRIEGFSIKVIAGVFVLKILAGITMYFIYTRYYPDRSTADIFKYFDDSRVMYEALWSRPLDFFKMIFSISNDTAYFDQQYYHHMNNWFRVYESNIYNDSHTIIRINAVIRIFSFGYFNVHTVFMCFISLTGMVALYRFFMAYLPYKKKLLFFAVFLIPSVVFWGSGVLKEAVLLFGIGVMLFSVSELLNRRRCIINIIMLLISLVLLLYIKYYIFIIIIPLTLGYVWCRLTSNRQVYLKYGLILALCIITGLNIQHVFPEFNALNIIAMKQNDFVGLAKAVNSGSLISEELLEPTLSDFIVHTPVAFFNTLVRPYIFESGSVVILFAALENIFILLLALVCIVFASKKIQDRSVFLFCMLFFTSLYVLTGLTTPVFGAMVRYKVPAMPFLLIFLFMLLDTEKLIRRFPVMKKLTG